MNNGAGGKDGAMRFTANRNDRTITYWLYQLYQFQVLGHNFRKI